MQKVISIFLLILTIVSLSSCNKSSGAGEIGTFYRNGYSANDEEIPYFYSETYNGFYSNFEENYRTLEFTYDKPVTLEIGVTTKSGFLGIKIVDSAGIEYFNQEHLKTDTYTVILDRADTYKIIFIAENHKGGYEIRATDI